MSPRRARRALLWLALLAPLRLDAAPTVDITGQLATRGIRAPAIGVEVVAEPGDHRAFTDADGRFVLTVMPGPVVLRIDDPAHMPMVHTATVGEDGLDIGVLRLTPRPLDEPPVTVYGRQRGGTVTLGAETLAKTAGTLGDPLRAVQSMPSVGTILSLVPFPIIRGSVPGDAGLLIDGTPVPMLFHSGIGQGVVPGPLVGELTLHAGLAPVSVGRFTGGVIDVRTANPVEDGLRGEVLVDLVQSSALVSVDAGPGRLTVAGRYGYPGWLLEVLGQPGTLEFSDYHLRYAVRQGRRKARVALFGAADTFGDSDETATRMGFHRWVGRWVEPLGDATFEVGLDGGRDTLDLPEQSSDDLYFFRSAVGARVIEWLARGHTKLTMPVGSAAILALGVEAEWRRTENSEPVAAGESLLVDGIRTRPVAGAWIESRIDAGPLSVTPGARVDVYGAPSRWGFDPRLDVRLSLGPDTQLTGRIGLAHAPQRYAYPIPGVGDFDVTDRLQRALQTQIGVEQALADGMSLRWAVFAHHIDGIRPAAVDLVRIGPLYAAEAEGRARGMDILLRRPAGRFNGWLSYTVQRVDRRAGGGPWATSTLEQNHLLNGVVSFELPAGWVLGLRAHAASGRIARLGDDRRLDGYAQLDVRIEKNWIADLFVMSAWLDVVNATYAEEPTRDTTGTEPGNGVRLTLPMAGLRGRF